jgi:dolichol-phosphate mannosyltransferase
VEHVAASDPRICLITHEHNQGVGAAVITGYQRALADGAEIIIKLDGDGQMDPARIPELVDPLVRGEADYVKGNRFFHLEGLKSMPWARLVGNAGLSFLSKLSTGYWNLFDPTNGYTAIHASLLSVLPLEKVSRRYFFESDLLFRLATLRAVVADVPMEARYADEGSCLRPLRALIEFPLLHLRNLAKRIFYNYFLRGFNMASIHLVLGLVLLGFGVFFGCWEWISAARSRAFASSGTVMLAAMPIILGTQLLLSFVTFDVANVPRDPIHRKLQCRGCPKA